MESEVRQIELSEKIELILDIFEQCKLDYQWYQTKFKDEERLENNIRHEIEGVIDKNGNPIHPPVPPKYERRAVLSTKWQNTLITRRISKDNIDLNKPLVDFINSDAGKDMINKLKQKLGDVRKIENDMQDRVYFKRKTNEAPNNPVIENNLEKLIRDWKKKGRR